ncbi:MAG: glyoxalase superfamily protein [Vicinamibacterales bacterium]
MSRILYAGRFGVPCCAVDAAVDALFCGGVPVQGALATLRITNYAASKAFYVDKLNFRIDWEHRFKPHFPVFMQVSREGLTFFLTEHAGDCPVGGLLHLYVTDVDTWYAELAQQGIAVQEPPNESLQGLRAMTLIDPDGNKLRICKRLEGWRR